MNRFVLAALMLSACHVPTPRDYCAFTCSRSDLSWSGEGSIPDPTDASHLRWCVCRQGRWFIALPPRNPHP